MAYEIWDGFDHYDASHEMWDTSAGTLTYSSTFARFAAYPNCVSQGLRCTGGGSKRKNLSGNRAGLVVSMAFQFATFGGSFADILNFQDNGTIQWKLSISNSGALVVRNGAANAVQGSTAPGVVTAGQYYFIDVVTTFGSSTGSVTIYLSTVAGGAAFLTLTNINTIASANSYANQVGIGDLSGTLAAFLFDDFHCHTNTGAAPNSPMGEGTRIITKVPNGAGYATTLTPNGASANWQCVDDVPPDDDTTYVAATSFPLSEGYAIGSAGFAGTVNGVVRKSRVRKDDGLAHTFSNGVRSGTTNSFSTAVAVNSAYGWVDGGCFTQDPATSAAWSAAGADAAQPIIQAAS